MRGHPALGRLHLVEAVGDIDDGDVLRLQLPDDPVELTGFLVSRVGITPIVTTLGMNALLYGGVIQVSGGTPTTS